MFYTLYGTYFYFKILSSGNGVTSLFFFFFAISGAPFPKNLQLDRQLANSILVSWRPPDDITPEEIRSYHVFLDGDFKTAIRGNERTKALLENVESRKVHLYF